MHAGGISLRQRQWQTHRRTDRRIERPDKRERETERERQRQNKGGMVSESFQPTGSCGWAFSLALCSISGEKTRSYTLYRINGSFRQPGPLIEIQKTRLAVIRTPTLTQVRLCSRTPAHMINVRACVRACVGGWVGGCVNRLRRGQEY